jgi:hypothetical protein
MAEKNMQVFLKKLNRPLLATWIVLVFFLISLSGILFPSLETWSSHVANRNYNGEGLIEIIEAVCWLSSCILYIFLLRFEYKKNKWNLAGFWYGFFAVFCFFAFGEEISWGQNLFGFEPTESVKVYNQQKEYNLHNLNISEIFGLNKSNPIYRYLKNFTTILNPLFYLTCTIIWFIIPLMKRAGKFLKYKIIAAMPLPDLGTVIFCGVNVLVYLTVDKLFFDTGEIFELSLALVGLMVPLDVLWPRGQGRSIKDLS